MRKVIVHEHITLDGVIQSPGEFNFKMDEREGKPRRWNTRRAMRVLNWYHNSLRTA